MLNNKKYYMKLPKVKKDFFMPRKVTCILHFKQSIYIYRVVLSQRTHFKFEYCASEIACRGWHKGEW